MLSRERRRNLSGFVEPCLPTLAKTPPSGPDWWHDIKHDGFRIMARLDSCGPRLITRNGNDFSDRFPIINLAVGALSARSCLIDGETIMADENGLADFNLLRRRHIHAAAVLCAFDLLELDGHDLRRLPLEQRKRELVKLVRWARSPIAFNQHYDADGMVVFEKACALGCEGIVSKRRGSKYESGRSKTWLKIKNPDAPAATRVWGEDWH
jgi:bifunctional non-homologous end joining protein LigD